MQSGPRFRQAIQGASEEQMFGLRSTRRSTDQITWPSAIFILSVKKLRPPTTSYAEFIDPKPLVMVTNHIRQLLSRIWLVAVTGRALGLRPTLSCGHRWRWESEVPSVFRLLLGLQIVRKVPLVACQPVAPIEDTPIITLRCTRVSSHGGS